MGLTVSKYNGIDLNNIGKVTTEILTSLENKTVDVSKADLTRFTRTTQGVDLYSSKVSLDVQRQIAMTNAGLLDVSNALSSVQLLNAQAAAQLYNPNTVVKNVEGKLHINTDAQMEPVKEAGKFETSLNVFETQKDKKGSNPFSFSQFKGEEHKEEQKPLNLVA